MRHTTRHCLALVTLLLGGTGYAWHARPVAMLAGIADTIRADTIRADTMATCGALTTAKSNEIGLCPSYVLLTVGASFQFQTGGRRSRGTRIPDDSLHWSVDDPVVATVDGAGIVTARSVGATWVRVRANKNPGKGPLLADSAHVTVILQDTTPADTSSAPPPDTSAADTVPHDTTTAPPDTTTAPPDSVPLPPSAVGITYPSAEVAFILGPQIKAGSAANPWPWFDSNELAKGLEHCSTFPTYTPGSDEQVNGTYYDLGLTLYLAYYRSGDSRFLNCARQVTDIWWQTPAIKSGTVDPESSWAPRNISLGGLMLRALDGRPEMWPWITRYTRTMFDMWVGKRVGYDYLYYGVRDGGYMLLYAAWLAKVHPDAVVRAEFQQKAQTAAANYYARLQSPDGGWYWHDDDYPDPTREAAQPFMVGLLLDGMIATHRITGDATVGTAIKRAVEWLWNRGYRTDKVPGTTVSWRGMWYIVYPDGTGEGRTTLDGGWDTNGIREVRQISATTIHAFGYAYKISGDPKYKAWGDEIFAATYGKGQGPLSDPYYDLADYRAKEYNQSYRSGGRYLAWRAGIE